jgi:hypothetical protein
MYRPSVGLEDSTLSESSFLNIMLLLLIVTRRCFPSGLDDPLDTDGDIGVVNAPPVRKFDGFVPTCSLYFRIARFPPGPTPGICREALKPPGETLPWELVSSLR